MLKNIKLINYRAKRKLIEVLENSNSDVKQPMLSQGCIEYLVDILEPTDVVFEYGSGGSTTLFPHFVKKYITVEHTPDWYVKVKGWTKDIKNLDSYLVPPNFTKEEPSMKDPGAHYENRFCEKTHGKSVITEKEYNEILKEFPYAKEGPIYSSIVRYWQFKDYVNKIKDFPDTKFDKIIIDGRSRTFCSYIAKDYMHKDSILIIDDAFSTHPRWKFSPEEEKVTRFQVEWGDSLNDKYKIIMEIDGMSFWKLK